MRLHFFFTLIICGKLWETPEVSHPALSEPTSRGLKVYTRSVESMACGSPTSPSRKVTVDTPWLHSLKILWAATGLGGLGGFLLLL